MNQQFNVEQIMFAQDTLKETHGTVAAMKDANKALKKDFKKLNINQIEDMQDDIDEADLEAELAAMEDDPSLFFSSAGDEAAGADSLDLPASSSQPVEQSDALSLPDSAPAAAQ